MSGGFLGPIDRKCEDVGNISGARDEHQQPVNAEGDPDQLRQKYKLSGREVQIRGEALLVSSVIKVVG